MGKPFIWIGALVAAIGAAALAMLVSPYLGTNGATGSSGDRFLLTPLAAVIVGGGAIAAGFALIGVGIGRWEHPRRRQTLTLGQSGGKEV
jgi:hypothetical protein